MPLPCIIHNLPLLHPRKGLPTGTYLVRSVMNGYTVVQRFDGSNVYTLAEGKDLNVAGCIDTDFLLHPEPQQFKLSAKCPEASVEARTWAEASADWQVRNLRYRALDWLIALGAGEFDELLYGRALRETFESSNDTDGSLLAMSTAFALFLFGEQPWLKQRTTFHARAFIQHWAGTGRLGMIAREQHDREVRAKNDKHVTQADIDSVYKREEATCPDCGTLAFPDVVRRRECCASLASSTSPA